MEMGGEARFGSGVAGDRERVAVEGEAGADEGRGADFVEAEVADPGEGGALVDGGAVAEVEVVGEELVVLGGCEACSRATPKRLICFTVSMEWTTSLELR